MQDKKLEEISNVFTGARLSRFNTTNNKSQPVIKIHPNNQLDYKNEKISDNLDNKFYTKKGDILIRIMPPYTSMKIDQEGLIIPMSFVVIRPKPEYDSNYIYYILKNEILPKSQNILSEGSTLQTIRTKYLKKLKIPVIEKEKQIKIGELLDLINKKKNLYKQIVEIDEKMERTILKDYIERRI